MKEPKTAEDTTAVLAKMAAYVLAWLGSWTLAEVQQLAGIVSAIAVAVVAMLNGYLLWRDRVRPRPRFRGQRQPRQGPPAPPAPLPPPDHREDG